MRHRGRRIAVGVVLAVPAGGAGLYWWMFGGSAPAEVALPSSSPAASGSTPSTGSTGSADAGFEGVWAVDTETGSFEDFTSSFAGYRVEEELGGIGANTAVGRTPDVSGTLEVQGTAITAVSVEVDMTTLTSDDERRDNSIRTRGLETGSFPTAAFELTEPIEVGEAPGAGDVVEVEAVGELTLHGVTRQVTVPIQARWTGELIEVVASFDVALADYDIEPPTGFLVLSIADAGTIELNLLFGRAA